MERPRELGNVPQNGLLVTAEVVGLYHSITHQDELEALSIKLDQWEDKIIPTEKFLIEITRFVLKNNHFESDSRI